jgi:flagellar hook-associated protein 3 FlgL
MPVNSVSTQSVNQATRQTVLKLQQRLVIAQKEVAANGRFADVGATLGARTSESVSLRQELGRLGMIIDTNSTISSRLDVTQEALDGAGKTAQSLIDTMIASRSAATGSRIVHDAATAALSGLTDTLNTSFAGGHLFAGVNTDVRPLTNYFGSPTPANRQAVADAFQAQFGFTQDDPAVASISAAQIGNFIDTTFSALFEEPAWSANWSNASDENIQSRISVFEVIDTSANANEDAFRKLAKVYTMLSDLGIENMSSETFSAVVDKALVSAGESVSDLAILRANLGTAEGRIASANTKMEAQIDILTNRVNGLEAVDPFDAAVRVTSLLTQIETAYSLTARIQRLTLLNYL